MYYLIYGFLYLLSLLPFFVLYRISDGLYVLLYYISGYRKKVVMANLDIAFPQKTTAEKTRIAKQFYKNLIDTFIETIKLFSLSEKSLLKRALIDFTEIEKLIAKGKNIQMHSGHQMNWEYGNWIMSRNINIPWVGVYMKINNKALDKLFFFPPQ